MRLLTAITLVVLIIGGLNWGFVGLFGFDIIAAIFGEGSIMARILYTLIGACAIYQTANARDHLNALT